MYDTDNMLDFDSYINSDTNNSGDTGNETEEEESGVYENVSTDEFLEQLVIINDNQQIIINNLSYQSNLITFALFFALIVLVLKCLLHFFN